MRGTGWGKGCCSSRQFLAGTKGDSALPPCHQSHQSWAHLGPASLQPSAGQQGGSEVSEIPNPLGLPETSHKQLFFNPSKNSALLQGAHPRAGHLHLCPAAGDFCLRCMRWRLNNLCAASLLIIVCSPFVPCFSSISLSSLPCPGCWAAGLG